MVTENLKSHLASLYCRKKIYKLKLSDSQTWSKRAPTTHAAILNSYFFGSRITTENPKPEQKVAGTLNLLMCANSSTDTNKFQKVKAMLLADSVKTLVRSIPKSMTRTMQCDGGKNENFVCLLKWLRKWMYFIYKITVIHSGSWRWLLPETIN